MKLLIIFAALMKFILILFVVGSMASCAYYPAEPIYRPTVHYGPVAPVYRPIPVYRLYRPMPVNQPVYRYFRGCPPRRTYRF